MATRQVNRSSSNLGTNQTPLQSQLNTDLKRMGSNISTASTASIDSRVEGTSRRRTRTMGPKYTNLLERNDFRKMLPYAKIIAEDPVKWTKFSGSTQKIVYDDNSQAIFNDTRIKVPHVNPEKLCMNEDDIESGENKVNCGELFGACLRATDEENSEDAAKNCMKHIAKLGGRFFETVHAEVDNMHPQDAVTFLQNLGYKSTRRNNMLAFETTNSWKKRLPIMLQCNTDNKDLCNILKNLKLMEYIELVWNHVHSNPQILNRRPFNGHHLEAKDGDCCGTKGFDIKVKRKVPGSLVSLQRLMYQIKRQRDLQYAMLGIPKKVLRMNLVGGGPETHILNNFKSFELNSSAEIVNEMLKLEQNSASKLTNMLNLIVKEADRHLRSSNKKLSDDQVVKDLRGQLQLLSNHERKLRRMIVALAMLVDKISLHGTDIVDNDVSMDDLDNTWKALQRYATKSGRTQEQLSELLSELMANADGIRKMIYENGEFDDDEDMEDDMM